MQVDGNKLFASRCFAAAPTCVGIVTPPVEGLCAPSVASFDPVFGYESYRTVVVTSVSLNEPYRDVKFG